MDIRGAYENGRRSPIPEDNAGSPAPCGGRPSLRVAQHRDELRTLVDFTDEATLLDEVGLRLALRDLLQVEVDVVASDALRGEIRDRILAEAVPV